MNPAKFVLLTFLVVSSCARRQVTEEEARQIALTKIERAQDAFGYDPKRLPPPSVRRVPDGFDFEARDESQNVSIFVHVSPSGVPEISAEPLDEERRRHEEAVREATSRRAARRFTCSPWRVVKEDEARQVALAKIEDAQSMFGYDPKRLPPPSVRRVPDGFDFDIRDGLQNVSVFVHVSPGGLPDIRVLPLDEEKPP